MSETERFIPSNDHEINNDEQGSPEHYPEQQGQEKVGKMID